MNIILTIIGIACFAVLFAEASGIMFFIKKYVGGILFLFNLRDTLFIGRMKPLDCPMCLSWWIGMIWFGVMLQTVETLLYAAICSIVAIAISKILYKL
jgi:hypothetical protein